jgi:predicted DNA-binding protein with PD1-like motif
MTDSTTISAALSFGRIFLGTLSRGTDLLQGLAGVCHRNGIRAGLFSLIGTTRSAILGTYDPKQQVYATRREAGALEIVHCAGTILSDGKKPALTAHIVLCREEGSLTGGRLFSQTPVVDATFEIRELTGRLPKNTYDPVSGRMRLDLPQNRS